MVVLILKCAFNDYFEDIFEFLMTRNAYVCWRVLTRLVIILQHMGGQK